MIRREGGGKVKKENTQIDVGSRRRAVKNVTVPTYLLGARSAMRWE
jgi:hypothetical protein